MNLIYQAVFDSLTLKYPDKSLWQGWRRGLVRKLVSSSPWINECVLNTGKSNYLSERQVWTYCGKVQGIHVSDHSRTSWKKSYCRTSNPEWEREGEWNVNHRYVHMYVIHENMVTFIDKRGVTGGSCNIPHARGKWFNTSMQSHCY